MRHLHEESFNQNPLFQLDCRREIQRFRDSQ